MIVTRESTSQKGKCLRNFRVEWYPTRVNTLTPSHTKLTEPGSEMLICLMWVNVLLFIFVTVYLGPTLETFRPILPFSSSMNTTRSPIFAFNFSLTCLTRVTLNFGPSLLVPKTFSTCVTLATLYSVICS